MPHNILIIITDQLTWRALPAYGDNYVKTPNIDRIAKRAVRFTEAYTPCPLCQPARAAFWTGRFPHETGVLSNGRKHPVPPVPETMPTLGELFSQAGYETMHFGKCHDAGSLRGFTIAPVEDVPVEAEPAWPLNGDTFRDRDTTVKTVNWLKNYTDDKPYLAVADLINPHNICGWVGANQGVHEDVPIPGDLPPLPDNFEDADFAKRPLPVQYICCSHNRLSQAAPWNETNYRHYLAAYYHYIERVDAEIGLILDALEGRPDADDTLIVFFADHGDGMTSHRMATKQVSLYEETTHVPFMVAGPGVDGLRDEDTLTSLLDLLPTLCDYAGIAVPEGLWGRSLVPAFSVSASQRPSVSGSNELPKTNIQHPASSNQQLSNSETPPNAPPASCLLHPYVVSEWHTEWGFTISPGRMLRTPRYKYVRYLEGADENRHEEFYNIQNDRGETRTLIDDPAHAAALEEHRRLLDAHLEATNDDFATLAWKADARWRSHELGYPHHVGPAAPMVS